MLSESSGEEVPHLTEAFQAARRAYGLASALLIAWELIGIDFGASPIESLNITLKSPQAVPYVLTALTLYFAFRLTIEWYQTDERRRGMRASRIDFIVAHLIGAVALILYTYQTLRKVQVANLISPAGFTVLIVGFIMGFVSCGIYRDLLTRRVTFKVARPDFRFFLFVFLNLVLLTAIWGAFRDGDARELFVGMSVGVSTRFLVSTSNRRLV